MNIPSINGSANYLSGGFSVREQGDPGQQDKNINRITGKEECETCKNRRYQDGSDDPGVSFKTAGKIDANNAAATVRSHEQEHVGRERAKAIREDKEVISQTVRLKNAICPECGKAYVAGGVTETVTRKKPEAPFDVGFEDESKEKGRLYKASI